MIKKTPEEKYYFLSKYIDTSISKDGLNANIWCPFCKHPNKNKLKMVIHLESNMYHCWLCDKKGRNVSYLLSRISKKISEESQKYFGKNKILKKSNILSEKTLQFLGHSLVEESEEKVEIPQKFDLLVNAYNSNDPDVRDVFKYAIKRGASKNKFWFLRLGYSLHSDFRRYLILPSLDANGEINFYTARKIDVDTSSGFKYKNAAIQKKNIIFNEINIDWSKPLTIVEGPLDLLKTNENATCLLGSSLTEDMLLFKKIIKNNTTVNLALDSDVYHKTLTIAKLLDTYNITVNIVNTRGFEDVGEMTSNHFLQRLEQAKVFSDTDYLLKKISTL